MLAWSSNNTIADNWIFDSVDAAIVIRDGSSNTVSGNRISNNGKGLRIEVQDSTVAASNLIYGNEIRDNQGAGVEVADQAFGNTIWANEIHDNGGLGIDLSPLGAVNPNNTDSGFLSTRGNRSVNFPVVLQAKTLTGEPVTTAQVLGSLSSANGKYVVRFYASDACDASGFGEGGEMVGSVNVEIVNAGQFTNGTVGFSKPITSSQPLVGHFITATTTDSNGNTSEFGACLLADGGHLFRNGFE